MILFPQAGGYEDVPATVLNGGFVLVGGGDLTRHGQATAAEKKISPIPPPHMLPASALPGLARTGSVSRRGTVRAADELRK